MYFLKRPVSFLHYLVCTPFILPSLGSSIETDYDYIIIGGGLSGMTLANRLSEDPSKTILVLEAGGFHSNDPIVAIPGMSGSAFGNATLDWDFSTIPQPNSNNNTYTWHRGKGLGGSTLINLMAWGRPALPEIDAMGNLGNPGWTGENLFKYMRKAENFTKPPQAFAIENNLTYITAAHGNSGPLFSSFSNFISAAQAPWLSVLNSLGVAHNQDALSGSDVGVWMAPATVNAQQQIRSDAASAYYIPVSGRANLVVETGAEVLKIALDSGSHGNVRASQVQYIQGGQTLTVNVTEGAEVILSASAVKTPQLLELSGIGDPDILEPLGIDVKVNLPGVGAGVIDQVYLGVSYELTNNSIVTLDDLRNTAIESMALEEYETNKTGLLTYTTTAFSLLPLTTIVGSKQEANQMIDAQALKIAQGNYTSAEKERLNAIITGLRSNGSIGHVEVFAYPSFFTTKSTPEAGKKYLSFAGCLQFPFSTGTIHITSTDATVQPAIDPGYFTDDFDLDILVSTVKFIRKVANTGGFQEMLGSEVDPGTDIQSDSDIIEYIKNFGNSEFHTVGSAAMLPREKGGVVSPELKVYGTDNIRVVDLSILPLQISAHPMSTLYGVSEKAADIIKGVVTV